MQESYEDKKRILRIAVNNFELNNDIRSLKKATSIIYNILQTENFTEEEIKVLMGNLYY